MTAEVKMTSPKVQNAPEETEEPRVTVSLAEIRRVRKCIEKLECYHVFREGQDGFHAMLELRRFFDQTEGKAAPYGYCPHCREPAISRDERSGGNDYCKRGHVYPSKCAR